MTDPLLELRGIHSSYGRIEVLRGVDLVVPPGKVVALLGPNGAGKTTTVGVCSGLQPIDRGELRFAGRKLNGARPEDLVRAGVCTVPEGRGIFANLTVRENLAMATFADRVAGDIEEASFEHFPRLADRRNQVAGTLSGGEQQMLAMARGLTCDPALLMLDELSMGLAPLIVEELYETVSRLAADGLSILVVEQFARTVLGVADTAAIMLNGRVTAVGPPDELSDELAAAYLGE